MRSLPTKLKPLPACILALNGHEKPEFIKLALFACEYFELGPRSLTGRDRTPGIAHPRQITIVALYDEAGLSWHQAASLMGLSTHHSGVNAGKKWRDTDRLDEFVAAWRMHKNTPDYDPSAERRDSSSTFR